MRSRSFATLMLFVLALAVSAIGCPCARSAINANEGLRWWLFSNFGASKICPEMTKRGVPLKLPAFGTSSIGRFFPQTCNVHVDDAARTIVLSVSGTGYAMLPVTRRVGFYVGMSVEYRPDFRLEEDAMYVWGRFNRLVTAPDLRLIGVENSIANLATQTPLGDVATLLGQSVVTSEIGRGFTVVRQDSGDDFALDILMPPAKPKRPFSPGSDHVMLATDVSTVSASSREYLGPFAVDSDGAALFVTLRVAGAPVDYVIVDKNTGDLWRQHYERALPIGPAPSAPLAYGPAPAGDTKRTIPIGRGSYYVVIENRAAQPLAPFGLPITLTEALSYVTYGIEVGDRP